MLAQPSSVAGQFHMKKFITFLWRDNKLLWRNRSLDFD